MGRDLEQLISREGIEVETNLFLFAVLSDEELFV
jgi:hypothetical protein